MRALVFVLLSGCMATTPVWGGGRVQGPGQVLTSLGAGAEVILAGEGTAAPTAAPAPVAALRVGLPRHVDIGLFAFASGARLDVRREFAVRDAATRTSWSAGLGAGFLCARQQTCDGVATLDLPVLFHVDFGGVYLTWMGVRAHASLSPERWKLGGDAVLGFAAGWKRVHAFVEATLGYRGGQSTGASVHQLVLAPSFGLSLGF